MTDKLSFFKKLAMAFKAFREADMMASLPDGGDWDDYETRRVRYDILWSLYENTTYSNIHSWSQAYRNRYAMYKFTRNLYNPAAREAEFWEQMVWGGSLDLQEARKGAVPVLLPKENQANEEALRKAITDVWRKSNFALRKDTIPLWGAALGDVGIKIVDDRERGIVYSQIIHPSIIKDIEVNNVGWVKRYELFEKRYDNDGRVVDYAETAERGVGEDVVFRTFANGKPYAFGDTPAEWVEPYGFIPFVIIQHRDVGLDWGYAEIHKVLSKVREIDDLASKTHDQIRKSIDPFWLFNFSKPKKSVAAEGGENTLDRPQRGREEVQALYIDKDNASGQALIASVDLGSALTSIDKMLSELERELPELQDDIWTASGDASGEAISKAREKVGTRVVTRRQAYDAALVRLHQMAIAIGGHFGYQNYEGFDLESYKQGKLEHFINPERPIFQTSKAGEQSEFMRELGIIEKMVNVLEMPLETALRERGWDKVKIKEMFAEKERAIKLKQEDKIPDVEQ